MNIIKLDLKNKNVLQTIQFAKDVKGNMTASGYFPDPDPDDAAFQLLIDDAEQANNAYKVLQQQLDEAIIIRDQKVELLRDGIRGRATYAEGKVKGDKAKLEAVFETRKDPAPVGDMPQIENLNVSAGDNPGELDAQWDRERNAKAYEIQISPDPFTDSSWAHRRTETKSKTTIPGLASGSKVWLRVRAVGTAGEGPWSNPVVKVVP